MSHVRFDAWPRVHNHQVDAISPCRIQNAAQLGRIGLHQRGRFRLPSPPPGGGTALRIKVDQQRPLPDRR